MTVGWRNAMAAVGLLGGLLGLVGAAAAVQAVLPEQGPPAAGDRIDVGYGVSLAPPPGARHDPGVSRPGSGVVELAVSGVRLKVAAVYLRDRPADFLRHVPARLDHDEGLRASAAQSVRTAAGAAGERGDVRPIDGPDQAAGGCYAAFAGESAGVTVLVTPLVGCAAVPPPVWDAVASLRFTEAPAW